MEQSNWLRHKHQLALGARSSYAMLRRTNPFTNHLTADHSRLQLVSHGIGASATPAD